MAYRQKLIQTLFWLKSDKPIECNFPKQAKVDKLQKLKDQIDIPNKHILEGLQPAKFNTL